MVKTLETYLILHFIIPPDI